MTSHLRYKTHSGLCHLFMIPGTSSLCRIKSAPLVTACAGGVVQKVAQRCISRRRCSNMSPRR